MVALIFAPKVAHLAGKLAPLNALTQNAHVNVVSPAQTASSLVSTSVLTQSVPSSATSHVIESLVRQLASSCLTVVTSA